MVRNIMDVGRQSISCQDYTALYARMQTDTALRDASFNRLKFMFTAAAALDSHL